jgi:hypothetical protein
MHEGILDLVQVQEQGGAANQIQDAPLQTFFSHVALPNFGVVPDGRFCVQEQKANVMNPSAKLYKDRFRPALITCLHTNLSFTYNTLSLFEYHFLFALLLKNTFIEHIHQYLFDKRLLSLSF